MALALVVLVPVIFYLLRKIGDVVPGLIFCAVAVLAMFTVPPKWPVGWLIGLIFGLPLLVACVYKMIRGDGRGTKESRLP